MRAFLLLGVMVAGVMAMGAENTAEAHPYRYRYYAGYAPYAGFPGYGYYGAYYPAYNYGLGYTYYPYSYASYYPAYYTSYSPYVYHATGYYHPGYRYGVGYYGAYYYGW